MKKIRFRFLLGLSIICTLLLAAGCAQSSVFPWSGDRCKQLHQGLLYAELKESSPRPLRIYCVRVDLKTPGLYFKVSNRAERWGEPMPDCPGYLIRVRRETTRNFLLNARKSGINMVLAVNGSPWGPWKEPWNHPYADFTGLLISDGTQVAPPHKKRPSFVQRKDGSCGFETVSPEGDVSHLKLAISGFGMVLEKGEILKQKSKSLAPRTGYGLSKDGKYLYLLVADGRQPGDSEGLSLQEVGEFLRYFGAYDGINMDGGGSSSLVWWNPHKTERFPEGAVFFNHQPKGVERSVAAQMGICFQKSQFQKSSAE